jgi:hypothetical protein
MVCALLVTGCQRKDAISIPSSGLQLWLKADEGVTISGSRVLRWKDRSGKGNDAFELNTKRQPTYVKDALGGKPAIRFDGTDDRLGLTGSSKMSSISLFLVVKLDSGAARAKNYLVPILFGNRYNDGEEYGLGTDLDYRYRVPDHLKIFAGMSGGVTAYAQKCVAYGHWRNINVVTQDVMWKTTVRVNGVAASMITYGVNMTVSVPLGNPNGTGRGALGTVDADEDAEKSAPTGTAKFEIAEVIVYNVALADSTREAVERYLGQKYQLPPAVAEE